MITSRSLQRRAFASTAAVVGVALIICGSSTSAGATSPSPVDPSVAAVPSSGQSTAALPTPGAADPTATPTPSSLPSTRAAASAESASGETVSPTASTTPTPTPTSTAPTVLSLRVDAAGSPVAGQYFEDIGAFQLTGSLTPARAGATVVAYWYRTSTKSWIRSTTGTTNGLGGYALRQPVGAVGTFAFRTTLGPPPGTDTVTSSEVRATVRDATISLSRPAATVDAMVNPTLSGVVAPARAGVRVSLDVASGKTWRSVGGAVTDTAGRYAVPFSYGTGSLSRYTVRVSYRATNRARTEVSNSAAITRVKVLNAVQRATTASDVAKTYRSGCPVGPSKLRTIAMNFYGYDGRMHRGVIIIRTSLADDTIRAFDAALEKGYPIAKLDNPNVYGGNDPKQMAANNTSGFNCRKVVGNPLRQSPHSYGIAIDVNTVQNPYRDAKGKWWPSNGKKYIKRSPVRKGMLTKNSALTKQLRKDKFFWGGFWNPGRDYQHFEKR